MASKTEPLPREIHRRGHGFLARVSHQGHQVSRTFKTLPEAELWLAEQRVDIKQGHYQPADEPRRSTKSQVTFAEFAKSSIQRRNLTAKTLYDYNLWMQRHLLPHFGELRMRQITVAKVNAWFTGMDKRHPTTRARVYEMLKTIFKHAVEEGVIDTNPCKVRNGTRSQSTFKPAIPDITQVATLIEAMGSPRYKVMCQIAAWCGLRQGELFALRRCDIRIKDGQPTHVLVRSSVTWVDEQPVIKGPKSRSGVRDVPIPRHIRQDLADHLMTLTSDPQGLVFPSAGNPAIPMRCATLYKVYYRARQEAGLPKLRWHDLRHFAATQAAIAGATTRELMTIIGHSTPNAAMRYQQVANGRLEDIAERMAEQATKVVRFPSERIAGA